MKKTHLLSAILAGSLLAFGGFGCSHNSAGPAEPNSVSGQAAPTTSGGDSSGTIDERQNVNGKDGTIDTNQPPVNPGAGQPANPEPLAPTAPNGTGTPGGAAPSPGSGGGQ